MSKYIDIECKSLQSIDSIAEGEGIMVTNPPYGERIAVEDMEGLYHDLGERLKRVFKGYKAWVIGYKTEYFDCVGLKPSVKMPLLNGELECELREYVMFDGKYDDLRRDGGSIKDEDFAKRRSDDKPYHKRRFEETFKSDRRPRHFDDEETRERRPRHFKIEDRDERPRFEKGKKQHHDRFDDGRQPRRADHDKMQRRERSKRFDEDYENESTTERKFVHSEDFSKRVVKFREPQLSKDNEVLSNSLRRRGWRKKDAENGGSDE